MTKYEWCTVVSLPRITYRAPYTMYCVPHIKYYSKLPHITYRVLWYAMYHILHITCHTSYHLSLQSTTYHILSCTTYCVQSTMYHVIALPRIHLEQFSRLQRVFWPVPQLQVRPPWEGCLDQRPDAEKENKFIFILPNIKNKNKIQCINI